MSHAQSHQLAAESVQYCMCGNNFMLWFTWGNKHIYIQGYKIDGMRGTLSPHLASPHENELHLEFGAWWDTFLSGISADNVPCVTCSLHTVCTVRLQCAEQWHRRTQRAAWRRRRKKVIFVLLYCILASEHSAGSVLHCFTLHDWIPALNTKEEVLMAAAGSLLKSDPVPE